jgi:hypothetical protein
MSSRHGAQIHVAPNHYLVFGLVHLAFYLLVNLTSFLNKNFVEIGTKFPIPILNFEDKIYRS